MRKPKTHKSPRIGSGNTKSPGARKVAKKKTKRAFRREEKDHTKDSDVVNEAEEIAKFIMAISSKKYALANKYLKGIVEEKVKSRISSSLNEPLF